MGTQKNGSYPAIIRTPLGTIDISIPNKRVKIGSPEELMNLLILSLFMNGSYQFYYVEDPDIMYELLQVEKNDPQRTNCFPLGVIYGATGQTAQEYWENEHGSTRLYRIYEYIGGSYYFRRMEWICWWFRCS